MSNFWSHILTSTLIFIVLRIFYKSFKNKWPEQYFSTTDYTSRAISISPRRYLAFRLLPSLVINLLFISILNKYYPVCIFISLISSFLFSLSTYGLAIFRILIKSKKNHTLFNKYAQISSHLFSIISTSIFGLVGGILGTLTIIQKITPSIEGIVDNLWSSLLAVLLAGYLITLYQKEDKHCGSIYINSLKEIDNNLITLIISESKKYSINPLISLSICIVENIQRPKWLRKLEKFKSNFIKEGTYGIMQIKSKKYITDSESVKLFMKSISRIKVGVENGMEQRYIDYELIKKVAKLHNPDRIYIEEVTNAYNELFYSKKIKI